MEKSLAARSLARQRAAGGPAEAGVAGISPPGAAFSRQPADFYTALI